MQKWRTYAIALCLLGAIAALSFWVRSRSRMDMAEIFTNTNHPVGILTTRSGFCFYRCLVPAAWKNGPTYYLKTFVMRTDNSWHSPKVTVLGLGWNPEDPLFVVLPYWLVAFCLTLPGLWRLRALYRMRSRIRAGQCLRCGYDMRASGSRCPECGWDSLHVSD